MLLLSTEPSATRETRGCEHESRLRLQNACGTGLKEKKIDEYCRQLYPFSFERPPTPAPPPPPPSDHSRDCPEIVSDRSYAGWTPLLPRHCSAYFEFRRQVESASRSSRGGRKIGGSGESSPVIPDETSQRVEHRASTQSGAGPPPSPLPSPRTTPEGVVPPIVEGGPDPFRHADM